MPDESRDDKETKLVDRGEFISWKRRMRMIAMPNGEPAVKQHS